MDMKVFVKQRTGTLLKECEIGHHFFERLKDRIFEPTVVNVGYETEVGKYKIVGTYHIPESIKTLIKDTYERIIKTKFGKNRDVAIKMADIIISPKEVNFNLEEDVSDEIRGKVLVIVDEETQSNGNRVYAIVRHDVATTLFFGKSYVPITKEKLNVDILVNNLNNFH